MTTITYLLHNTMFVLQRRTRWYLIFTGSLIACAVAWAFATFSLARSRAEHVELESTAMRHMTLGIRGMEVRAEVADTLARRMQGLSGRSALVPNTGMLLVFEEDDLHGIWMRDMRFPIDILWLDSTLKVVSLKERVDPASYPETFYPSEPVRYVLELPAGFMSTYGISEGDQVWVEN